MNFPARKYSERVWRLTACAIISFAAAMALVRILLPVVLTNRGELQNTIRDAFGQPVAIETIKAGWRGWAPEIHLSGVTLSDPKSRKDVVHFGSATLVVDALASIWNRAPQFSTLIVSDIALSLVRTPDGAIKIQGVASGRGDPLAWLLSQEDIVIENARLTWRDRQAGRDSPLLFSRVRCRMVNQGTRHRIMGYADLPSELIAHRDDLVATGKRVVFALEAEGNLLGRDWSAKSYLAAHNVGLGPLLRRARASAFSGSRGAVDFRLWTTWKNARLHAAEIQFNARAMRLRYLNTALRFAELKGMVGARLTGAGRWHVVSHGLRLRADSGWRPTTQVAMRFDATGPRRDRGFAAAISFVRLGDVLPAFAALPGISPEFKALLKKARPSGKLLDARLTYTPSAPGGFEFRAGFSDVHIQAGTRYPAATGLAGGLRVTDETATLRLDPGPARVDFPDWAGAMPLAKLAGKLSWEKTAKESRLRAQRLRLGNGDLEVLVDGELYWALEGNLIADLAAQFQAKRLDRLVAYLPPGVVPKAGRHWLTRALSTGRVESGQAILKGPLSAFPFDRGEGRFEIVASVEDAVLDYAPRWPRLEAVAASVRFRGREMLIEEASGKVFGATIHRTTVRIPDLLAANRRLLIDGHAGGPYQQGYRFVMNSPLSTTIGRQLSGLEIAGPIGVDLALEIPLGGREHAAKVSGAVQLRKNRLRAEKLGITLEALDGALAFNESRRWGDDFHATYLGYPVTLDIDLAEKEDAYSRVDLRGRADREFIKRQLAALGLSTSVFSGRSRVLRGQADWKATLKFPRYWDAPHAASELLVQTDLKGVAIDAPFPVGKLHAQRKRLRIAASIPAAEQTINFALGKDIGGELTLTSGLKRIKRLIIRLGDVPVRIPEPAPALLIAGQLPHLDIGQWRDYLAPLKTASTGKRRHPDVEFDLRVKHLNVFDQRLNDVVMHGRNGSGAWSVTLRGPSAKGRIRIPAPPSSRPIEAELEHLRIADMPIPARDRTARAFDPGRFPPLRVTCKQFVYKSIDLGEMTLRAVPRGKGMRLTKLVFTAPQFTIDAQGDWLVSAQRQRSRVDIGIKAGALDKLLGRFGYDVTELETGATEIDLKTKWRGAPADFSLAKLSGRLEIRVENGRVLDIDHRMGRIFGLLNFRALQRRLSLDFDDVFKKGFAFDHLRGTFRIANGNAYTDDLTITGPSARILITGRTGLATKDYDQIAAVTPALADSLPVASALFGPVGAGVGAGIFVAERVFDKLPKHIDGMLSRRYSITGHWRAPVIKPLAEGNRIAEDG